MMPPAYLHASERIRFAQRRRAWFVQHHTQPTILLQDRTRHAERDSELSSNIPHVARIPALMLVLGVAGIACIGLLFWIRP